MISARTSLHLAVSRDIVLEPFCLTCLLMIVVYPSEMTAGMLTQDKWPRDFIPEQRAGDIKDMAGALLFLTSRAGAYISGNVLLTDGGRLSILPATY